MQDLSSELYEGEHHKVEQTIKVNQIGSLPLVDGIICTSDLSTGFQDVDYAFMIGSKPLVEGMTRSE